MPNKKQYTEPTQIYLVELKIALTTDAAAYWILVVELSNSSPCSISDFATRRCSERGLWLDDDGREGPDPSWTNFSACFTPELTKVIEGFYANISGAPSINYKLLDRAPLRFAPRSTVLPAWLAPLAAKRSVASLPHNETGHTWSHLVTPGHIWSQLVTN